MQPLLWLLTLSALLQACLSAEMCKCKDGSLPINFKDINSWQNANDPSDPQTPPPEVDCGSSVPDANCPSADMISPKANNYTDVVKKGKCFAWAQKDGELIPATDLTHPVDPRQCDSQCATEIAYEQAKGNASGSLCRIDTSDYIVEGDYRYIIGDCICNPTEALEIGEVFVEFFIEALPKLAGVIVSVWEQAFELVITLPLGAIPGVGGALEAAVTGTIAAAKLCEYTYDAATGLKAFVNWAKSAGKLGKDIGDTYKKAKDRTDQPFKPPEGLPKGSGQDGDQGAPKDWDKLDDGSNAIGDQKGGKAPKDKDKGKPKDCDKSKDKDCDKDKKSTKDLKTRTPKTTSAHHRTASTTSLKTSTASSTITGQPCSPSCAACGSKPKAPRRGLEERSRREKPRSFPLEKRRLREPADYGNDVERFLLAEYDRAEQLDIHSGQPSAGFARWLPNNTYDAAVGGLYGCTSVIVASQSAVWVSHFWEIPSFRATVANWHQPRNAGDRANFDRQVIQQMQEGGAGIPGLRQFTGEGSAFHPDQIPFWTIITPTNDPVDGASGRYRYDEEVAEIQNVLRTLFPRAESMTVPYVPNSDPTAQETKATGKVLFQFDPFQDVIRDENDPCSIWQQAIYRIWVEDRPTWIRSWDWRASVSQLITDFTRYGQPRNQKRDNTKCKLPDPLPQAPATTKGKPLSVGGAPDQNETKWIVLNGGD